MDVGETVVLVGDVDGMPAGKEGLVMRVRGDMLLIGIRSAERLVFVLVSAALGSAAGAHRKNRQLFASAEGQGADPDPSG
jgi:hypothetical protein